MRDKILRIAALIIVIGIFIADILAILQHSKVSQSDPYLWEQSRLSDDHVIGMNIAVSPSGTLFAASVLHGLVFRSTDGGRHWERSCRGIKKCCVTAVAVDSKGTVFCASGRGVYRSINDGKTWELANVGLPIADAGRFGTGFNGSIYAAGLKGAVFRSDDHGLHWQTIRKSKEGQGEIFSVCVTRKNEMILGTEHDGLYRSADKGAHWNSLIPEFTYNAYPHVYNTFESSTVDSSDRIYVAADIIFLGNNSRDRIASCIMRSDDGGKNWIHLYPGQKALRYFAVAVGDGDRVLAGSDKGLFISSDGGKKWIPSGINIRNPMIPWMSQAPDFCSIAMDRSGKVYALCFNGDVWIGTPRTR